jgi:acetyl-CoA carboxylase biotin carboxylase subunit
MFSSLLIANRGEIALRVLRTAREMSIKTIAVYSDSDRDALHVREADRAVHLGGSAPSDSYLRADLVLEAAQAHGAEAIHPGYGFLAENASFAKMVGEAGLAFIGPSPQAIQSMGDKVQARKAALAAGVRVIPGLDDEGADPDDLIGAAKEIGYPVMLKAAAGGGGKGIRIVETEGELAEAAQLASAEAEAAFGDGRVYLEKFLRRPRHVEVQIMADQHGKVVTYGERECSVQRRHQKLVEESPSPAVDEQLRARMEEASRVLAKAVGYVGAGTVEFLVSEGEFYFLEMNTRLQVEHAITEERFGVDLVREQLRVAAGLAAADALEPRGHSIEVRINAEDPVTFLPSLGQLTQVRMPGGRGVRVDSAVFPGSEVTPYYDSMLAKLIVLAADRDAAIARMIRALEELKLVGVKTAVPIAVRALDSESFRSGDYDTGILAGIPLEHAANDMEMACIASAYARYRRLLGGQGKKSGSEAVAGPSAWVLAGRQEGRS